MEIKETGLKFETLKNAPRLLLEVELEPVQGSRFQPTGFPDLGAAEYERPDGTRMLLVESAQSMANRLEHTCLDGDGPMIAPELEGLPYVLVKLNGAVETETSSLVEAHRINSPFIISDKDFRERFMDVAGYAKGKPLDWKRIGGAFLRFDPNSLLHGAFMANLEDGRVKVPRAITGFIEAEGIAEASSGGVKNNPFDPTGKIRAVGYDKDVYSNVPYHRTEYTAKRIVAYFNLDLSLIGGYGLEPEAHEMVIALGLYKIRRFLNGGLRLRTACDLRIKGDVKIGEPKSFTLPDEAVLLSVLQERIKACAGKNLFQDEPVTTLETEVVMKGGDKEKADLDNEGN